jgi:hypothetical protein
MLAMTCQSCRPMTTHVNGQSCKHIAQETTTWCTVIPPHHYFFLTALSFSQPLVSSDHHLGSFILRYGKIKQQIFFSFFFSF